MNEKDFFVMVEINENFSGTFKSFWELLGNKFGSFWRLFGTFDNFQELWVNYLGAFNINCKYFLLTYWEL